MLIRQINGLGLVTLLTVIFIAIPLFYVIYNGFQLSTEQWFGLWGTRLPRLMSNTLSLAFLVAIGCFVLGVSTAWVIARRQFWGRRLAIWLMVLPLTIPTYVYAHIYTILFEDDGWLGGMWNGLLGGLLETPDLYNVWGAAFVLILAGYSYIFLLVKVALMNVGRSVEEAARIQGARPHQVLWRITLPLMRPAIAAGLALVVLHTLSDFGAVSMLRFQTFTLSIYTQMNGRFDFEAASALSLILVVLSLTFLVLERFFRRKQKYYSLGQTRPVELKAASFIERWVVWGWLGLVAVFAFLLPLAWLVSKSWMAWIDGVIGSEFWLYTANSFFVAFIVASIAVIIAVPIGLYHTRVRSVFSQILLHLSNIGFVLPGPVIALGALVFVLGQLSWLYGTLATLVIALVIRFAPLAVQAQEAALQQLTPSIEQVGRVFGAGPFENFCRVTLPIIRGGVISAWVLVFIDVVKELPATLLLRPIGFDTLPVRIWIEASEEMLELAAPAALMLVLGSVPALWIMMKEKIK